MSRGLSPNLRIRLRQNSMMMAKFFLVFFIFLQPLEIVCQNRNISNGLIFDGEPYLAVNPYNPRHMVVAWMGFVFQNRVMIRTRTSLNGGDTWSPAIQIPHAYAGYTTADPSMAFDDEGNVFLCYVDYDPGFSEGAVYVRKSADGGFSWGEPVEVIDINADPGKQPIDRPWICIDRSGGTHNGNIYVVTVNATGAEGPPYHPYFIRSTDQGASFDPWRYADTTGYLAGSLIRKPMPTPAVSTNGTFHCIYPSYVIQQGLLPEFILASSSNAGTSFIHHSVFSSGSSVPVSDTSAKKGYLLKADPGDPAHLVFMYLSNQNGDPDVYFRESYDAGESWSEGIRVNDDPVGNNRMQDLIWAGFDSDGDLAIAWRDRRHAADTGYAAAYDIYCAARYKNSPDFLPNFRITDATIPFNDVLSGNGNDFLCLELFHDTLNAVWGDTREGNLSIWFQRATLNGALLSARQLALEDLPRIFIRQTGPNAVEVNAEQIKQILIYNQTGALITGIRLHGTSNQAVLNLDDPAPGLYLIKTETAHGILTSRVFLH